MQRLLVLAVACCSPTSSKSYTPLTVLGAGMKTPDGKPIDRAHEPSLLFIPPDADSPNGTLVRTHKPPPGPGGVDPHRNPIPRVHLNLRDCMW